jgi:hypothetical protein
MEDHPILTVFLAVLFVVLIVLLTPWGRAIWNNQMFSVQKVDDATNYSTIKQVEDTCRAMIASYESDNLYYNQYKSGDTADKKSWAEQAKMRANKTASTYNNYILKNSFVWSGNVPNDIRQQLPYIE